MSAAIQNSETAQGAPIYQGPAAEKIGEAIENVRYAISRDETRYNLNIVHLEGRWAYATDGHRLAACRFAADDAEGLEKPLQAVATGELRGKRDGRSMVLRPATCDFPNVRAVIPKAPRSIAESVQVASFADVLAMRQAVAEKADRSYVVTLESDAGGLFLRWRVVRDAGAELGAALRIGDAPSGLAPFRIGFNGAYLREAAESFSLWNTKRELRGEFGIYVVADAPADKPVLLGHPDGKFAVVMPMRL
jgi:DNA polymerase III sliding clamp (beta) subunit (PCNA family)